MKVIFARRALGILYRFIKQYSGNYAIPANVCPVVPLAFKLAGVNFVFVDIDKETLCVDELRVTNLVKSKKIDGLLFVRTYGYLYDSDSFFCDLKSINSSLKIIDDRCLCKPDFSSSTTFADLILYSTGYAKQIDLGYGGFGFLNDGLKLSKCSLNYYGYNIEKEYKEAFKNKTIFDTIPSGWLDDSFMDEIESLRYKVEIESNVDKINEHKNMLNSIYNEKLPESIRLKSCFQSWRYNILVENKNHVLKSLFDAGLFASSHYYPSNRLFDGDYYENSEWLHDHIINLFNDGYYDVEKVIRTCDIISQVI